MLENTREGNQQAEIRLKNGGCTPQGGRRAATALVRPAQKLHSNESLKTAIAHHPQHTIQMLWGHSFLQPATQSNKILNGAK